MSSQVIETKEVKVQASPAVREQNLTPLAIYDATCEVTEYTTTSTASAAGGQSWKTEHKSIGNIYVVVDDNGNARRFGSEFFRQV